MASFDTASKKQAETNPEDFVQLCFKFGSENFSVLEVITPEQPTIEMHQADTLIKVLYDGTEALVHFEFQTADSYDPEMSLRMAGYIIRAIEVYRLPVYSNVLYLGPNAGRNDPGKFTQNLENHNISIEYKVFRLSEIDGQAILDLKLAGLTPFTPLMQHPPDIDAEQWLRRCIQTAVSIDVPNKAEFLGSLAILGNLIHDSQTILDMISEETMQHPHIVDYVAPQAYERGKKENTREKILELLTLRLKSEDAQTLKPALEAIDDIQRLNQLFQAAMQVETLEEFRQALNDNSE